MQKKETKEPCTPRTCRQTNRSIKDALDVLNGMWKLQILVSLSDGEKRFKEISKDVEGISDKMLSKELKALEINQLIKRTVYDTFPPTVKYNFTEHAHTLSEVMIALSNWGILHRKKIIGK
jgi:DNA-binding HxlR family transcriptional regulator